MAAKLKKRALAEYQSQVLVEDKTEKTKRLKLVIRKDSSEQEQDSDQEHRDFLSSSIRTFYKKLISLAN